MSSLQETRPATQMEQDTAPVVIVQETTVVESSNETLVFGQLQNSESAEGAVGRGRVDQTWGGSKDATTTPVTIGEALENVASKIGDKPLTVSDARAIQSAEARATGIPTGVKGGPGAASLSAINSNREADVKIGDVLADASARLPQNKIVTRTDASRVHSAEARNNDGLVEKGGVASAMQRAAAHNQNAGFPRGAAGGPHQRPPAADVN